MFCEPKVWHISSFRHVPLMVKGHPVTVGPNKKPGVFKQSSVPRRKKSPMELLKKGLSIANFQVRWSWKMSFPGGRGVFTVLFTYPCILDKKITTFQTQKVAWDKRVYNFRQHILEQYFMLFHMEISATHPLGALECLLPCCTAKYIGLPTSENKICSKYY